MSGDYEINFKQKYAKKEIENFRLFNASKECIMGESFSFNVQASGRGLGKMAAFMANNGCLGS
jgi:hypothetical protein